MSDREAVWLEYPPYRIARILFGNRIQKQVDTRRRCQPEVRLRWLATWADLGEIKGEIKGVTTLWTILSDRLIGIHEQLLVHPARHECVAELQGTLKRGVSLPHSQDLVVDNPGGKQQGPVLLATEKTGPSSSSTTVDPWTGLTRRLDGLKCPVPLPTGERET